MYNMQLVDGVLLVVGAGTTPRQAVIGAKNSLDGVGARILGVLNQVDIKAHTAAIITTIINLIIVLRNDGNRLE